MAHTSREGIGGAQTRTDPPGAFVPSPSLGVGLLFTFLLLALALTWPLARDVGAGLPRGTEPSATVPLFNLWTLAWNHDRLAHGYRGYWEAPIFWPEEGTFALSEPQPLTGLLTAPLVWMTGSEVVSYNLFVLLALTLNGFAGLLLLRALGLPPWIAWAGGASFETLPFVHQELGVLQLVPIAGLLALIMALLRLTEEPTRGRGVLVGAVFAATYLLCGYYGIFALVAIGPAALWWLIPALRDRRRRRPLFEALALAAAVSAVLVAPVALGQWHATRSFHVERSIATVQRHSARPVHFLRAPWPQWIPLPGVETTSSPGGRAFFPGTVKVVLAVGLLVVSIVRPRRRGHGTVAPDRAPSRRVAFFVTLVALAGWLSCGPGGGSLSPYPLMHALVPGFASLRSLFRLAVLVQIGVVALAALALHGLARSLGRGKGRRVLGLAVPAVLALLLVGEQWPRTGPIQVMPAAETEPPWLQWVRRRTGADDVFAFFPFPQGRRARDYAVTAQWMYWQTFHWRPMVNGYSGYFPASFRELKRRLRDFPSSGGLAALVERGTRFCVVLRSQSPPAAMLATRTVGHELRPAYHDPAGVLDIYEIVATRAGTPGSLPKPP